jgi:formylglycine-generating enzyme required for sulfatase activity
LLIYNVLIYGIILMIKLKTFTICEKLSAITFSVVIVCSILTVPAVFANNLKIESVALETPNSDQKTVKVKFDISWENSWKNAINKDAVWVFGKYTSDNGATWRHMSLKTSGKNPAGFFTGTHPNLDIVVPSDRKGCFLQRANVGAGSVNSDNVELIWDWGADGLSASDTVKVKIVGVEMVYVPEGAFFAGDGNGTGESPFAFHAGSSNSKIQINNALTADISVDSGAGDDTQLVSGGVGIDGDGGLDTDNNGTVDNTGFPSGYKAFYVMKYEITEEQWIDFFNVLSSSEKARRDITGADGKNTDNEVSRNTISWAGHGDAATLRPDRACSYLSWMDMCAYADWAGLRPLTETEYEKTARGANSPVLNEYAWGNATIESAAGIAGAENGTETVSNSAANCCYNGAVFSGGDGGEGPLRAGIFATASSSRRSAGAGYYGVMELSGNLRERCVTLGNAAGRAFTGSNGDGALEGASGYEGNANNADWPGYVQDQGVVGATGAGFKGGSWKDAGLSELYVSSRARAALSDASRSSEYGGRCARSEN